MTDGETAKVKVNFVDVEYDDIVVDVWNRHIQTVIGTNVQRMPLQRETSRLPNSWTEVTALV